MNQNKPVKVNEFFKKKINGNWNCPICGHSTKLVPNEDTAIMVRQKGTIIPNNFFPVQIIECAKCGFIGLFNSRVLGLLDEEDKKFISSQKVE